PAEAFLNPGSSKITHEPLSISVSVRATDSLSVSTRSSAPLRIVVCPTYWNSVPLRLRVIGGSCAPPPNPPNPPPCPPGAGAPLGAGPAGAGAAPGAGAAGRPAAPPVTPAAE